MSWDAYLTDDRGHEEGHWDYTHNCNAMIRHAMGETATGDPWWKHLDGLSGPEGAAFLHKIIRELQSDPMTYEAMNPPNGWGDYDGLLEVLMEMRSAVPEWPTTWSVSG